MNVYYNLILDVVKDFKSTQWQEFKKDGCIFSGWDLPYEIIQSNLGLNDEDFKGFMDTDAFDFEWNEFCRAEQLLIKEYTLKK